MANRTINMPVFSLEGKTAIITGGTKGIGYGIACTFANFGANVVITARTAAAVEEAADVINAQYCKGGKCMGIPADSSNAEDIAKVVEATVAEFGRLDILVNNAGMALSCPYEETTWSSLIKSWPLTSVRPISCARKRCPCCGSLTMR